MSQPNHSTALGQKEGLSTHTHSPTTSHTLNHRLTHSNNITQGSQKFLCGCCLSCRFVSRIPFHSHPSSRFVSRSPFMVTQFARFTWMKAIAKAWKRLERVEPSCFTWQMAHNWLTYTLTPTHKLKTTRASWTIMSHLNKWLMYAATKQFAWIKRVLWNEMRFEHPSKENPTCDSFCLTLLLSDFHQRHCQVLFPLRTHIATWMFDPCRRKWLQIIATTTDYDYSTTTGSIAKNL